MQSTRPMPKLTTMKAPRKKRVKLPDVIKSLTDEVGNQLVCRNNGKRIIMSLKLVKEDRHRRIGIINIATKTMEVRRKRDRHLFIKGNSYGFNHQLLADAKLFDKIRLFDEIGEWLIPKAYILTNGSFLNFINKGGFERQTFVTLEEIEQFKRKPKF